MKILKVGGSLLAPKNTLWLDIDYCTYFFERWKTISPNKILVHGAGNIGHGFIKKYGLTQETYLQWRKILHEMFVFIDAATGAVRLDAEEIMYLSSETQGSFVLWWDIRPSLTISSWDAQFPEIMNATQATEGYMLTNVPGVLDKNNQIIPVITKDMLSTIDFWEVHNDVTWWMKGKLEELFDRILAPCSIWVVGGNDLDNVSTIMRTGIWIWTKIVIM